MFTVKYGQILYIFSSYFSLISVSWFGLLVDGLSSPEFGFDPKKFHVNFVVDSVTQE
jgi:hypothetical protein